MAEEEDEEEKQKEKEKENEEEERASHAYPFSVDNWVTHSSSSSSRKHFFLTHAHLDHTRGISSSFAPIYCSPLTAALVLLRFPQLHKSSFVEMNIEEPLLIRDSDGHSSFTVTAYDANHCPGAVMFLFEGNFGTVLHTGDCRITPDCYAKLPRRLFGGLVDCLFLDCTFGKEAVRMPQREDAIKQVKQCIWNHPKAPIVYLACDLLGQELLLNALSCTFGVKIYVDKITLPDFYGSLNIVAPDLVTDDPASTRLHVCEGFPKLYEKAKQKFAAAYAKGEAEPLFVRPSAQWYTYGERLEGVGCGLLLLEKKQLYERKGGVCISRRRVKSAPMEAERDAFGIWHACYSMHSSQDELEDFVSKLKPRRVISTTPHCRATELGYVVKSLKIYSENAVNKKIISIPIAVKKKSVVVENTKDETMIEKSKEPLLLASSESSAHCIPLFGMAVVGLLPSPPLSFTSEEDHSSCNIDDTAQSLISPPQGSSDVPHEYLMSHPMERQASALHDEKQSSLEENPTPSNMEGATSSSYLLEIPISSSSIGLNETSRRMYRSLNMGIPRPLPSLLELDREIKRSRF